MTKTELLETYTAEQIAGMVINLHSASEAKNDEIHKLKWQISSLEEENGRLKSKLDTYNNYLLPRCTKEAKEMIDRNGFNEVVIVTHEEWANKKKSGELNAAFLEEIEKIEEYKDARAEDLAARGGDLLAGEVEGLNYALEKIKKFEFEVGNFEDLKELNSEQKKEIDRMKSEVEKYRKAFEDAKKERDCQIAEYQKKIEELTSENKKCLEQIMASIPLLYGYSVSEVARAIFEHCNSEAVRMSNKNRFDYGEGAEKTVKDGCEIYILSLIKCLQGLCAGENYTEENVLTKFVPTEPIKVAEMLITAKGECEPLHIGNDVFKDTYRIFNVPDLRQIAEHLIIYCNHNGEAEE